MPPLLAAISVLILARICAWVEPGKTDTRNVPAKPWQSWQLSCAPMIVTFCAYSVAPLAAFHLRQRTRSGAGGDGQRGVQQITQTKQRVASQHRRAQPGSDRWPVYRRRKRLTVRRTA